MPTCPGANCYASGIVYAAHGALASGTVGPMTQTYVYNSRLQLTDLTAATASGSWLLHNEYGSTQNNGNLLTQTVNAIGVGGASVTANINAAGYDAMNRLLTNGESGSFGQTYGYDSVGNRWVTSGSLSQWTPSTANWYDGATNRLTNPTYYQYDQGAAGGPGNLTMMGGYGLAYDAEGRTSKVTIAGSVTQYWYDGDGRRVKKQVGTGTPTIYVYDASGELAAEYGGPSTATGTQYVVQDQLGSTRLVVDGTTGICQELHDYLPFGEEIPRTGTTCPYLVTGGVTQKFTGKERGDATTEAGLDYFGARYFSGAQGRFTSPDPLLGSANPLNPQSWNRYTYTLNNPLRYTDPFGLYEWDTTLGGSATDDELRKQLSKKAANRIIDRRNDIRKAIAKGVESNDGDVSGAYQAYGAEGEANGVTIASQKPKSGGVGAAGQQLEYVDGSFRSKATVSIDPKQSGNDLFITLAHEGSHVRDGQAYAAAAGRLGDVPALAPFNLTVLQTEMNAYSTSVNAARMLGLPNLNYSAGSQTYQIWRGGTAAVDRPVLEQYLRASPLYAPKLNNLMFPR